MPYIITQKDTSENRLDKICQASKMCKSLKSVSHSFHMTVCNPWTVTHQAPQSKGPPWQEYWSGQTFHSPGDFPDPGVEPRLPALQVDSLPSEIPGKFMSIFMSPKLLVYINKYLRLGPKCFCMYHGINNVTECKLFNSNLAMICRVIISISTKVTLIRTNETH